MSDPVLPLVGPTPPEMASSSSPGECNTDLGANSGFQTPSPMEHDSATPSLGDYTWTDVVNRRVKKQKLNAERTAAAA